MAAACQRLRIPSLSTILRSPMPARQSTSSMQHKEQKRVVVMGAPRVGKTCIVQQFLFDTFETRYRRTIEQLHRADYELPDGSSLTLDILDTSGSHEFPAMRALSIATAGAFILVYAVDDAQSWEEVELLRNQILQTRKSSVPIVIVANKMDLPDDEREIQHEVMEMITLEEWHLGYVECSAKNNMGIVKIFKEVLKQSNIRYNLSPAVRRRRQSLPTQLGSLRKPAINRHCNSVKENFNKCYSPVPPTNTSIKRHSCTLN